MEVVQRLKRISGNSPVDEVARLNAELAEAQAAYDAERADLERRETEKLRPVHAAAERVYDLKKDLAKAKEVAREEALGRHRTRRQAIYLKLKAALGTAVLVQAEALRADEEACRELGEAIARGNLPFIAYRGLLLPDSLVLWISEQDRVFAVPQPKPATAAMPRPAATAPAVKLSDPLRHAVTSRPPAQDPTILTAQRPLDDRSPLGPGECRFRASNSIPLRDDIPPPHPGQLLKLDVETARDRARRGWGSIVESYEPPAPESPPTRGDGTA